MRIVSLAVLLAACAPSPGGSGHPHRGPGSDSETPALPSFEPETMSSVPLLGGTMEAVPDLHGVLAADPEGDRLLWSPADASDASAVTQLPLGANARPFRVEVQGDHAWATLRGTGEVVEVDVASMAVLWRTQVCAEPRGLDHADDGSLVVACAGGVLAALDDATGKVLRWALLDPDLRDVVSADGFLYVSRFRAAEVLLVDPATFEVLDVAPIGSIGRDLWRLRADLRGRGGVLALYDEVSTTPLGGPDSGSDGQYASESSCTAAHQASLAWVGFPDGVAGDPPEIAAYRGAELDGAVLPVDFLVRSSGELLTVNGGGSRRGRHRGLVTWGDLESLLAKAQCFRGADLTLDDEGLTSGAAEVDGQLFAETVARATLQRGAANGVRLSPLWVSEEEAPRTNDPRLLFHRDPGSGVACASCHPDGQDDGNVWTFADGATGVAVGGQRHTLPLAGGIRERAPYHWMGELATPEDLMASTFTVGMGAKSVSSASTERLFDWLEGLRPVRRTTVADPDVLATGEELFHDSACDTCHTGEAWTTNQLRTVRGHETTKTPTLVGLGMRTSYMHDGCVTTLVDRLRGPETCTGGEAHGHTADLSDDQVDALAAWLETL